LIFILFSSIIIVKSSPSISQYTATTSTKQAPLDTRPHLAAVFKENYPGKVSGKKLKESNAALRKHLLL
jgi:hypothetical protein